MKLWFKQNTNFLSETNKKFIETTVLNKDFPYYFQAGAVSLKQKDFYFSHKVLNRLEDSEDHSKAINTNITTYHSTLDILKNFTNSIGEKPNFFTRIGYNLTFNNGFDKCEPHQDHDYDHKQMIIYLNDSDAKTCIVNKGKIVKEITPKTGKGICFNNLPHYAEFPKSGARLVLVATFI